MPHEVFICYATHNKAVAEAICAALESRHIKCWIAPRDVLPGTEWAETIVDALDESRVLVLVLSSSSNTSPQVIREVGRAASNGIPIMSIRIDDVVPSKAMDYFISSHQWLDAQKGPLKKHFQRLADTVQQILARKRLPQEAIERAEAEEKARREAEEFKKAKEAEERARKEAEKAAEEREKRETREAKEKASREAEEARKAKEAEERAEREAKEVKKAKDAEERSGKEAEEVSWWRSLTRKQRQIAWSVIIVLPIIIVVSIFLIFYPMIGIGSKNREISESNEPVEEIEGSVAEKTVEEEVTDELEEEALDESEVEEIVEETNIEGKIAFHSLDRNWEVYIMNVDGTEQVNLTNNPAGDWSPSFSPDGSKITFSSDRDGNNDIYIMNVDGTEITRLTDSAAEDWYPSFSH